MELTRRALAASLLMLVAACGQPKPAEPAAAKPPLVYAAASLTDVLKAEADAFAATGKAKPEFSFAASSELARQIEQGAQADLFISADEQWMDYLDGKGLVDKASRVDMVGNSLVLVAPADKPLNVSLAPGLDLAAALGDGKLAMGDPDAVPAGKYGKAALTALGAWAGVEPRVVRAANVREALRLVAAGEAAAGVVYATDAKAEPKVQVAGVFPDASHPPIVYPMALVAGRGAGKDFADFLRSGKARAIFEAAGFAVK